MTQKIISESGSFESDYFRTYVRRALVTKLLFKVALFEWQHYKNKSVEKTKWYFITIMIRVITGVVKPKE